jgi:hypothetical protein
LDDKRGAECTETLTLLDLYGPNGKRYESRQVLEMINDSSPPVGKPAKRLLKFLRELDRDWLVNESRSQESHENGSNGQNRMDLRSLTHRDA